MFGLSKFQIAVLVILVVLVYHQRKVYEAVIVDASKVLTSGSAA